LKFTIDNKKMKEVFDSIQVKGKYAGSSGFSSSSLGTTVQLTLTGNNLRIYNGNATFIVRADITVEGEENGSCVCDVSKILSYLKTFSDAVTFTSSDFIMLSSANKRATVPLITGHDTSVFERITQMLGDATYQLHPTTLLSFGKSSYEGAFSLLSGSFASCMQSMELVKAGTYKLDYKDGGEVVFSSRQSTENRYEEQMVTTHTHGEAATIEFTSPIHKFFDKNQLLNFYVKDEFPILIMAEDRLVVKAPSVSS